MAELKTDLTLRALLGPSVYYSVQKNIPSWMAEWESGPKTIAWHDWLKAKILHEKTLNKYAVYRNDLKAMTVQAASAEDALKIAKEAFSNPSGKWEAKQITTLTL